MSLKEIANMNMRRIFEVIDSSTKIKRRSDFVEKCVYCEGVYESEDSLADNQTSFCSTTCEENYEELFQVPLRIFN